MSNPELQPPAAHGTHFVTDSRSNHFLRPDDSLSPTVPHFKVISALDSQSFF
jgi:hypothetical protein